MTAYCGSCHCGDVAFRFESEPIETGVRCNCSICSRCGIHASHEATARPGHFRVIGCVRP